MKLYDCKTAPSPRRTRILLAEKGLTIETIQVDLASGAHLEPTFLQLNPNATVPVLVLDDGTALTENAAIAAYLEAACPEPPMLGTSPLEKAMVAGWNDRCMMEGFQAVGESFRNHSRGFKGRALTGVRSFEQVPELVERGRERAAAFFDVLDQRLADSRYLASERFSIADITALCMVDFAAWIKLSIGDRPSLQRWHDEVSQRPSATA